MKKSEYISAIRQRLTGGLPDRTVAIKYPVRLIERYMDAALATLLNQYVQKYEVTDDFLKTFYPYLLWDDKQNQAYITIPASMVQLPETKGLRWVSGTEDTTTSWDIIPAIAYQVYANMESGQTNINQICYVEGGNIIVPKVRKSQTGICVKVKIFCTTNGYTMDEEFAVPASPLTFIDMVCKGLAELKMTPDLTSNIGDPNANRVAMKAK